MAVNRVCHGHVSSSIRHMETFTQTDTILFIILVMTELAQVRNVKISATCLSSRAASTLIWLAWVLAISGTNCTRKNIGLLLAEEKEYFYPFARQG